MNLLPKLQNQMLENHTWIWTNGSIIYMVDSHTIYPKLRLGLFCIFFTLYIRFHHPGLHYMWKKVEGEIR
jgi:hypothetical protein